MPSIGRVDFSLSSSSIAWAITETKYLWRQWRFRRRDGCALLTSYSHVHRPLARTHVRVMHTITGGPRKRRFPQRVDYCGVGGVGLGVAAPQRGTHQQHDSFLGRVSDREMHSSPKPPDPREVQDACTRSLVRRGNSGDRNELITGCIMTKPRYATRRSEIMSSFHRLIMPPHHRQTSIDTTSWPPPR